MKTLDALIEHSRDLIRHLLAAFLLAGTLTATSSTFSNGRIQLAGAQELIVSTLGISLALEVGALFAGWFLGQLDERLQHARRELRAELEGRRKQVRAWFYVIAGISGIANLIYRVPTYGGPRFNPLNMPAALPIDILALFVSAVPVAMIILFMIVLRPLPQDHREKARLEADKAMVSLVTQSARTVKQSIRQIGRGRPFTPAQLDGVRISLRLLAMHQGNAEASALHSSLLPQGTADGPQTWVNSAQLQTMYNISERAAQYWLSSCLDARPRADGTGREAPLARIIEAHGAPLAELPAPRQRRQSATARRNQAQAAAETPQLIEADPQPAAG